MSLKIYTLDSLAFPVSDSPWGKVEKTKTNDLLPLLVTPNADADAQSLLLLPNQKRPTETLQTLFSCGAALSVAIMEEDTPLEVLKEKEALFGINRKPGVKGGLEKGSTIFSETFFHAGKIGSTLDPLYNFSLDKLGQKKAVDVWASLQAAVYVGIRSLPSQGANGTGERVEVQVGCDEAAFCFAITFDLSIKEHKNVCHDPALNILRSTAAYFETRFYFDSNKIEIFALFPRKEEKLTLVEVHTVKPKTGIESNQEAREYTYKTFQNLSGEGNEEKRVFKGKFKKKFSESVKISGDTPKVLDDTKITIAAEKIVDADNDNFLVRGEILAPHVSPEALISKPKEDGKSNALLESKIQSLEATLKQRDELVAKLNKEIEEIKDPMKMGVISSIKDNQVAGLKDNIKRLQTEVAESQEREKELMSVVDKAIVIKDEATKKVKDLETKLRQFQGGNNSKVTTLEKQLEEAKKQNKDLMKRITTLTEQIQATGKKVA